MAPSIRRWLGLRPDGSLSLSVLYLLVIGSRSVFLTACTGESATSASAPGALDLSSSPLALNLPLELFRSKYCLTTPFETPERGISWRRGSPGRGASTFVSYPTRARASFKLCSRSRKMARSLHLPRSSCPERVRMMPPTGRR